MALPRLAIERSTGVFVPSASPLVASMQCKLGVLESTVCCSIPL